MPKFIKTDRVAISDDAGNTVWVRRKMDLGAVSRIQGATDGQRLVALYAANILEWEGPDFKGFPCTEENIATIDPDDAFWTKVADKIAALNAKEPSNPLQDTTGGAASSEDATTAP